MLEYMKELRERFRPVPDHAGERAKIKQIFNELKPNLACGGARLRCLLDIEKKLREEVAEENFAAGFALGWEIRTELENAGVLSAHSERTLAPSYQKGSDKYGKTQTLRGRHGTQT